jgi:hypothetical protein
LVRALNLSSREYEPSTINKKTIADFTRVVEEMGILEREPVADKRALVGRLMPTIGPCGITLARACSRLARARPPAGDWLAKPEFNGSAGLLHYIRIVPGLSLPALLKNGPSSPPVLGPFLCRTHQRGQPGAVAAESGIV